jgi:hypothetical protein
MHINNIKIFILPPVLWTLEHLQRERESKPDPVLGGWRSVFALQRGSDPTPGCSRAPKFCPGDSKGPPKSLPQPLPLLGSAVVGCQTRPRFIRPCRARVRRDSNMRPCGGAHTPPRCFLAPAPPSPPKPFSR